MQNINEFNDNLGTAIGLVGPAGSGKTVLGMRLFPKTAVIVLDLNFSSGKRYCEKIGALSNIVGFDTITVDETGKKVTPCNWYDRMFKKMCEYASDPRVDAIFVDGATQLTECIVARIVNAQKPADIKIPATKDSWGKWGDVGNAWRGLVAELRMTGKKLVLAIHEAKAQDESDQIWKYEILIPGKTKDILPNILSDVWRTEVHKEGNNHVWKVRTLPEPFKIEYLKNTYSLPALLLQDELVKKIQEGEAK